MTSSSEMNILPTAAIKKKAKTGSPKKAVYLLGLFNMISLM